MSESARCKQKRREDTRRIEKDACTHMHKENETYRRSRKRRTKMTEGRERERQAKNKRRDETQEGSRGRRGRLECRLMRSHTMQLRDANRMRNQREVGSMNEESNREKKREIFLID